MLKKLLKNETIKIKEIHFWEFPAVKIFNLFRLRSVFAFMGSIMGLIPIKKSRSNLIRQSFWTGLLNLYNTSIWSKAILPISVKFFHIVNKFFKSIPVSGNMFLILEKKKI